MKKRKVVAFVKGGKDARFPEPLLKTRETSSKAMTLMIMKEDREEVARVKKINLDMLDLYIRDRFAREAREIREQNSL